MNNLSTRWRKSELVWIILIAILTAISSEIKVAPFNGENFRFGLGSIMFLLLILIRPPYALIRAGIVTGLTVVLFRIMNDVAFNLFDFTESLKQNAPAFIYYFIFSSGFRIFGVEKYQDKPLRLGIYATLLEIIGNSAEHIIRAFLIAETNIDLFDLGLLSAVALLRSFFVVGLYSSVVISEQHKRLEEKLTVDSGLYVETLYLQKSMNHIEKITASSYDLYRKLKDIEQKELSVKALHIAQEIHEVKKDAQRIFSGLSNMTLQKTNDVYFLSNLLDFVTTANTKYSELLGKQIVFHVKVSTDFETNQQIPLLAMLNNLVANAVEAIDDVGEISIEVFDIEKKTCFKVSDSGKGISKDDLDFIFEPGFTTKYNKQGVAATGIGLSHVREIVQMLEGDISVRNFESGLIFRIEIPTKNIRKRVE
ncbi:ATP-binding protein [Viridibacillus arvi]|uniref:ATP-binding protein n=1 Tax=Viridibacillus arvi TaxID=263475 RepID=UPI00187B469F|nr:ATP-binding protein [Viridibacillus sp. JNUCC-6]QOV09907.1 GHKL domain-containing protein [Viridibacillus sp. JNUCC-6]